MWIDIHAHLYDTPQHELHALTERAKKNGVTLIVNTPTNIKTAHTVLSQSEHEPSLACTAGISAFDVVNLPENWKHELESLLASKKFIGVGEIGIDKTNPLYPKFETQLPVFTHQLEAARRHNIPAIIHSRGVEQQAIDLCKTLNLAKALFHCFTGDKTSLKNLLDAGYHVSYSGIVTFQNNPLEELVRYTPLEQLFIETDSPYLAPHPFRGKTNEPAYVTYVGEKIAEIKKIPADEVAAKIRGNFEKLFGIKKVNS